MAGSRARLEALLARVQQRASEPRSPSAAVAPILEAINGGNGRSPSEAPGNSEAPASVRAAAHSDIAPGPLARNLAQNGFAPHAIPENEVEEDIEEYDDELIEIIDDAEVIPQAAAVARAIEPAAFGAAVDRRPAAPLRSDSSAYRGDVPSYRGDGVARAPERPAPPRLAPEAVAARPVAPTDVVRTRGARRELRHTSFVELLDASLELG